VYIKSARNKYQGIQWYKPNERPEATRDRGSSLKGAISRLRETRLYLLVIAPALGLLALLQYIYHVTHTSAVPRRTRTQNDLDPFACEGDGRDADFVAA